MSVVTDRRSVAKSKDDPKTVPFDFGAGAPTLRANGFKKISEWLQRRASIGKLFNARLFLFFFLFPLISIATPPLEKRANALYQEVRCPVCLGQAIADSDADESRALKTFILDKLKNGESEDTIRENLSTIFGDEILLRPPFVNHTLILWIAPFGLFFLILCGVGWKIFRAQSNIGKQ